MTADPGLDIAPDQMNHVLADGNLHRCFCGKPIWFDAGNETRNLRLTLTEPCWRETNGQPHYCPEPAPPPGAAP